MDDDKTTMARICSELDLSISKWSDVNHTSKHLTNSLFTLQKKHKVLSNNVIAFLKKCFNYALAQTKGERGSCKLQIEQIVPHAFGEHSMCGDWCQFKDDPESYTHNTLIKDLSGDELRKNLETVSHLFSQNSENIAPGGSTREVESFNNMVASKTPKRHHFSASSNLLSRVGCAVVQKNISYSYTAKMNESLRLSPGQILLKEAASRDTERKHQKVYTNKKENKLKKVQNKIRKKLDLSVRKKHKGTTYKTAIAMSGLQYTIPVFTCPPELTRIHSIEHLVFCDIETSSLAKDTDILQLSACFGDHETFNKYVVPCKAIAPAASRVTGLTTSGGLLFLDGSPVPAVPLKDALSNFVKWLQSIGQAVLVGHSFKV